MTLIAYYDLMSQPCRAIVMFLRKTKIPFTTKEIAIRKGENKSAEYLAINPLGKVPVLQDTDKSLILRESVSILHYLSDEYGVADHWYPKDRVKRAKVDEYCAWQHTNTRFLCSRVFLNEVFPTMPQYPGVAPAKKETVQDMVKDMNNMLTQIEDIFLQDNNFLIGSEISLADILASCELLQPTSSGRDVLKNHPRLKEWMERVREEMNPHFDEVHRFIYHLRDTNLKKKSKL